MRILSALVLTHCFGCVIPKDSDDNFMLKPPIIGEDLMMKISSSTGRPVVSSAHLHGREVRYGDGAAENQTTGTDRDELAGAMDYHDTSSFLQTSGRGFNHSLPGRSASVGTRQNSSQVNAKQTVSWHHRPRGVQPSSRTLHRQSSREKWRTPLRFRLRHVLADQRIDAEPEHHLHDRRPAHRSQHSNGDCARFHEHAVKQWKAFGARGSTRVVREDDWEGDDDHTTELTEDGESDSGEWDEWTEWSECSASCGCGRQVRWRHCVGKGCMIGFKKAQIRMCHLRDCNSKNFLSWLGMKA